MAQDTLDRLEAAWKDLDRRVAAHDEDLVQIQRSTRLRSVRRHLWPFAAGQGLQLVAGLALMVPAVAVETDPGSSMLELGSAIVLHIYAVAVIAWGSARWC